MPPALRPTQIPIRLAHQDSFPVNPSLSILPLDHQLVYFHGLLPVLSHPADDPRARDRVLSLLVSLGTATVAQLARALDLSERTVARAVAAHGEAAFDRPRRPRSRTALQADGQLQ